MANNTDRWYFTKEQLDATPSRKCGYDSYKELSYRQQTANFIQDMGQRLKVSQLCINTAIVYMHRFYVFHSFTHFPWHQMGAAALFLAAKVEEQHRKLEYVIRVANMCRNNRDANIDVKSDRYIAQSQDLIFNETVLLQTLGFDVAIDHPHTHVVRCCHLVRASKDLAQSSYFLASNSLHLTTMCLQYKPTVVACFCIHLACKWSRWEIPLSTERKEWFRYVDPTVTTELLQQLTDEFLLIYESCPSRLKEKIMSIGDNGMPSCITNSPNDATQKKTPSHDQNDSTSHPHRTHDTKSGSETDPMKHRSSRPHEASSSGSSATTSGTSSSQQQKEREYREKKEREKLAQQHMKAPPPNAPPKQPPPPHGHHRPPADPKLKQAHRPSSSYPGTARPAEPRDILREAAKDSPFGIAREHPNKPEKSEVPKSRDYLLKPNVAAETNYYNGDGKVGPSRRPVVDPNKVPIKHEQARRHDDKAFAKPADSGEVKRSHGSAGAGVSGGHDRNSYLSKSLNSSTSQKGADASKSVPKPPPAAAVNAGGGHQPPPPHQPPPVKQHHHNGAPKEEPLSVKEEVLPTPTVKKPSLFSPEKSPEMKREMLSPVRSSDSFSFPALSPLKSPTVVNNAGAGRRARNYSSSSEPELRPVLKKIDQMEGFETLLRDSTIGINKLHQVPDIITPINDIVKEEPSINFSKEMKPPDIIPPLGSDNISAAPPIVNGIETNPTLISSLLKEAPPVPHLPVVKQETETKERAEHHHKSKKKNKEKHKHKDKEKSRDEKEKKKKHKDKDKDKHKHKEKEKAEPVAEPIKIKIQKDKIQPVVPINPLKVKIAIPKESKTESSASHNNPPPAAPAPIGGLKIKIPREVINNCSEVDRGRKRERNSEGGGDAPPPKQSRGSKESKQNGRHSYSKVTQLGDGDASIHRLAESKYINKSSTS